MLTNKYASLLLGIDNLNKNSDELFSNPSESLFTIAVILH